MTNREKFAEQILDIACSGSKIAVNKATLEPIACYELECKDCLFNTHSYVYCGDKTKKWAMKNDKHNNSSIHCPHSIRHNRSDRGSVCVVRHSRTG